jgi:uncharacterized coiled-coil protein SlyX
MTELENWQDLDSFRRTYLSKLATDINKAVEGILMYVSVQKIDESLRAGMSEHPRITEAIKQGMMQELQRQGVATKTEQEKEIERLKRQVDNLSNEMQRARQPAPEPTPEDEGGDDDGGEGGGEDTPEGDDGTQEGGQGDGGSGGEDGTGQPEAKSGTGEDTGSSPAGVSGSPTDKGILDNFAKSVKEAIKLGKK